ncbi:MAG: T9SS type A sorting domain-containing protein [Bacteroidetes bacterium]|nr:T9SS type A sorting domain-containing protein [Bacteroidota bacterium]
MKTRFIITTIITLCIITTVVITRIVITKTATSLHTFRLPLFSGTSFAIGDKKNPNARRDWEFMRLRNPATGQIPPNMRAKEIAFGKTLPTDAAYKKAGAYNWIAMGPYNVGGRTRAAAIDVTNENIILAGSISGGLWRSTDGGASWTEVTAPDQHISIACITQDTRPGKTNTWYFATGEAYGQSASGANAYYLGNGIYKSTDGGLTWAVLPSTVSNTPQSFDKQFDTAWNIVTDPSDTTQDEVYVAVVTGIYRSTNGGNTWGTELGGFFTPFSYFTDIAVTSTGVLYATLSSEGFQKGIWRSTDGATWTNITPSGWPVTYDRIVIGITPTNEDTVYFLAVTPGSGQLTHNFLGDEEWNSLWRYTYLQGNGADTNGIWTDLSSNIPPDSGQFGSFNAQGGYDLIIKVKPNDPNVVFIGGTNLFRSTDGFTTLNNYTQIGGYGIMTTLPYFNVYPNHHPDQHEILFLPSDSNALISVTDGGIFKTNNCMDTNVTWTPLNNGYLTTQFYTIALDHGTPNSNVIIGGLQDNGSYFINSANPVDPWTMPSTGDGAFCAITDSGDYYYFSRQRGKLLKVQLDSSGVPIAFTRIDPITDDTIDGGDYLFINPFILDPNNNNIMYLAEGPRLWRNNDLSQIVLNNQYDSISTSWFQFTDTLPITGASITALAASKTPANRLYYGTSKRRVYRIDNANTGDPAPTDITGTNFPGAANSYVTCIAIDPKDADKVLVVFSNYAIYSLFYSVDGGTSWDKVAGNLEQVSSGAGNGPSLRWAEIFPLCGDNTLYFVATSIGIYATDVFNGLSTVWVQQGANTIGNVVVDMIDIRQSDGRIVIGTHGNGVYVTNIITTAFDDYAITIKDSTIVIDVQTNDFGMGSLTTTIDSMPLNGSATVLNGDSIEYTPNPGFFGNDTLYYVVCDSCAPSLCGTAMVVIKVISLPVAFNDSAATIQDSAVVIDVQANDVGLEPFTTAIVIMPANGITNILNGDSIEYIPDPGFTGNDTIYYKICNNSAPSFCDTAMVIITVTSPSGIQEAFSGVNMLVYPNPVTSQLNIRFSDKSVTNVDARIIDIRGKDVYKANGKSVNGQNLEIPVKNLENGIYFLRIDSGGKVFMKKFVIQ